MEIQEYEPGESGPKDIWLVMTLEEVANLHESLSLLLEEPNLEWHHHLPPDAKGVEVTLACPPREG